MFVHAEETVNLPTKVMPNAPPAAPSLPSIVTTEETNGLHHIPDQPNQTIDAPNKPKYRYTEILFCYLH